ncbi:MAG: peptidylprolyl isomerase [Granulosicoccus sp.]|nr:peptidylprolyl isomerase [Granulosicoccus sp.]
MVNWIGLTILMCCSLALAIAQADEGAVSATVNGEPVYSNSVALVADKLGDQANMDKQKILDELIDLKLLSQAARQAGLAKNSDIVLSIQLQTEQTLANAYTSFFLDEIDVSKVELEREYDRFVNTLKNQSYRLSHVLLESKDEAEVVRQELDGDTSFPDAVSRYSLDPVPENAGDLGWFAYGSEVFEHSQTIESLSENEVSEPLQTTFGWHLFTITAIRSAQIPDYESMREELHTNIIRSKLNSHMSSLRSEASIAISDELSQ